MPQMMPLNWLMLFIYFIMIFLLFNVMNYYIYTYKFNNNKMSTKLTQINWKW